MMRLNMLEMPAGGGGGEQLNKSAIVKHAVLSMVLIQLSAVAVVPFSFVFI